MRLLVCLALFFSGVFAALGQDTARPEPGLPKDAHAVFVAATPYYNYADTTLKPWRLKASYQLYDDKGNPSEQGTYEYWWAAPDVHRSSWTRPSASRTNWHTADGKSLVQTSGSPLNYFEYRMQSALIHTLPELSDVDTNNHRLMREQMKLGEVKLPCIMVLPITPEHGQIQDVPLGIFPTYCFDPNLPALRIQYSFGSLAIQYSHLVRMQGHILPRSIDFFDGNRHILSFTVDTVTGVAPNDPAFTPAPDAVSLRAKRVSMEAGKAAGLLISKQMPVYPKEAKEHNLSGRVEMKAIIGVDGAIHDLQIVSASMPSMAASALRAVSHWQYKPYTVNGEPVDVETTIIVNFSQDRD